MKNHPIPAKEAYTMVEEYWKYLKKLGVDPDSQTQSVSFTASELISWMQRVMSVSDEFRIFFGVYPEGHPQAGRITSIIWPYKDGKPAKKVTSSVQGKDDPPPPPDDEEDPYNAGGLNP